MAIPAPAPGAIPAPAAPAAEAAKAQAESATAQAESEGYVERVRAWAGLVAIVAGDAAIALAAILGIIHFTNGVPSSQALPQVVAILSGAFTAIGTMTTAYFGIKSMSNTAKNLVAKSSK